MTFRAVVCGADRSWLVPTVANDPLSTFEDLVAPDGDRAVLGDATHVLLVTRREWEPAMRRLATLLRAHDSHRHVSVLATDSMPLGAAAVAEQVNAADLEPGRAARELRRQLGQVRSAIWVKRPGLVQGARPGWWDVIRSWWSKDGYLVRGEDPVRVARSQPEAWAELLDGAGTLHRSGEPPVRPAALLEPYLDDLRVWGRDASRGAKAVAGRQNSFEVAALLPGVEHEEPVGSACSGCGASVDDFCPFCHAQWGAAPVTAVSAASRRPEMETS
jgi:hypothetical protein